MSLSGLDGFGAELKALRARFDQGIEVVTHGVTSTFWWIRSMVLAPSECKISLPLRHYFMQKFIAVPVFQAVALGGML